jgi:hypothetical protein
MQTGPCLRSAHATAPSKRRCFGGIAVLVLGLAVSACVNGGQLANLTETARTKIAIESIEAPPSTDVPRFVTMLKDEAAQRRIAAGAPSEPIPVARIPAARTDAPAAPAARPALRNTRSRGCWTSMTATSIAWFARAAKKIAGPASASTDDQAPPHCPSRHGPARRVSGHQPHA